VTKEERRLSEALMAEEYCFSKATNPDAREHHAAQVNKLRRDLRDARHAATAAARTPRVLRGAR